MRIACHIAGGGNGTDLPADWKDPAYLGTPGPTAEYGHCPEALARACPDPSPAGYDSKMAFHHAMRRYKHNMGLKAQKFSHRSGGEGKSLRVRDWTDVMMAGSMCLTIILERAPELLGTQVRTVTVHMTYFCRKVNVQGIPDSGLP